jgi:hypothetical protein
VKCLNRRMKAPPADYILLIKFLGRPHTRGAAAVPPSIENHKNLRADHIDQGGSWDPSRGLPSRAENPTRWWRCRGGRRRPGDGKWGWWPPRVRPAVLPKILQAAWRPFGARGGAQLRPGRRRGERLVQGG